MLSLSRSLTGTVPHVFSSDPALDAEAKDAQGNALLDLDAFKKTGDLKHVPAKDGEKLTVFYLKPLSMKRLQKITSMKLLDGNFTTEQLGEAVAYGLKRVENLEVNGKSVELKMEGGGSEERVSQKSLEAIFKQTLFIELGSRVLEISDLSF